MNFHFYGTRRVVLERLHGTHYLTGLPVTLRIGSASVDAVIAPAADSDHLHRMVMTQKTSAVLAELIVDSAAVADTDQLAQAVSDLCVVLSVMRGTKVQWIYRQDWTCPESGGKRKMAYPPVDLNRSPLPAATEVRHGGD